MWADRQSCLQTFNSFVSDTVSLGFILFVCYLFVSVLCESVFVHGFPICRCKISLVFSLCMVNDMEREEGLGKNVFSEMASSRKALKFPVENVSTEISRGTISSHAVSRCINLCFSLFLVFYFLSLWKIEGYWSLSVDVERFLSRTYLPRIRISFTFRSICVVFSFPLASR